MGTITDSSGSRLVSNPTVFVSRHPIAAVIVIAIVFAGCAGVVAFGYVTVLSEYGLSPRTDAIALMGIIGGLLLTSGVIVIYLRQSVALEEGLGTLRRQSTLRSGELETLRGQTKTLENGMSVLAEQQWAQRAFYTPSIEIDRLRTPDRRESEDVLRFDIANLSFGEATNCTIRSEIKLIGAPDSYAVSGGYAICPLTRTDRWQRSPRVPPHTETLGFETNVLVDVSENVSERGGKQKHTVTCRFSDAMRVFHEDGVEAIELSFEFVYEDVFGDEYTEEIQLSRIDLTAETTLSDILEADTRSMPADESIDTWFQNQNRKTSQIPNK